MGNEDPRNEHEIRFRGSTIKLFAEGVERYYSYLIPFSKSGNHKINEKISEAAHLLGWLRQKIQEFNGDMDLQELRISNRSLSICKSTLPYLLKASELELAQLIKQDPPEGADQGLLERINLIKELMEIGVMSQVKMIPDLMGALPKAKTTTEKVDETGTNHGPHYVDPSIITRFARKSDNFNYSKLISLLEELNFAYENKKANTCAILIRAIIDHIPPLFAQPNFESVENQYSWNRTDRKYLETLRTFRNEGDDVMHRQISQSSTGLDMHHIPLPRALEVLLSEAL